MNTVVGYYDEENRTRYPQLHIVVINVSDVTFCFFLKILIFWHWGFALGVKIKRKLWTRWKAMRSWGKILEPQLDQVDHIGELVLQLATFTFIIASQISWKRDGKQMSLVCVILIDDFCTICFHKPHLFPSGFCSQSFQVDKLNLTLVWTSQI